MTEASKLARLELVCFGPPVARLNGGQPPSDVVWRKHLGLLIYLALSPDRARTRDHLTGLFWPEKPERHARHSLNEAIRRLRAGLGAERLTTRGETYALCEDALDVDVWRFAALAPTRPAEAAALLRGDFLEGFMLDDAPGFEDWAAGERIRWHARGAAALVAAGEAALSQGHLAAAEESALRALALEPHGEAGMRLRLRSLALRGDTAGALAAYHDFADRLQREIGEQPSRNLQGLVQRIRDRTWHRVSPPVEAPAPPLVGRGTVQEAAFGVIAEAVAGAPRTLVLLGPVGYGKTRLLSECLSRAALDGAVTVSATPLENDHDAPWSTLRALGRAGLGTAPGSATADPEALAVLGALLPGLAADRTQRPPTDHGEVASALSRLFVAVSEDHPLVMSVDDAHFADGTTLAAVGAAMAAVGRSPVLLLLTCLPEADRAPPALMRLRSEVGRRLPGTTLSLRALGAGDVRALVDALAPWCQEDELRDRLSRRVSFETEGNPFLVVTLLQALARASTMQEDVLAWPRRGWTTLDPLPISVPDLVRMAVAARLSEIRAEDLQLLRSASVAGVALDLDVIEVTSELPRAVIEESLIRLEGSGLVVCDGRRYAFAAPLIAEVVRQSCLTPGQRRTMRLRTAQALATRQDMEARVLRVELLAQAAPDESVLLEALSATDAATVAGAARSARRALAAAERVLAAGGAPAARGADIAARRGRLEELAQH